MPALAIAALSMATVSMNMAVASHHSDFSTMPEWLRIIILSVLICMIFCLIAPLIYWFCDDVIQRYKYKQIKKKEKEYNEALFCFNNKCNPQDYALTVRDLRILFTNKNTEANDVKS